MLLLYPISSHIGPKSDVDTRATLRRTFLKPACSCACFRGLAARLQPSLLVVPDVAAISDLFFMSEPKVMLDTRATLRRTFWLEACLFLGLFSRPCGPLATGFAGDVAAKSKGDVRHAGHAAENFSA